MTNKTIYIPYTYCITFLLTGQRYYGCRYAANKNVANPNEFWLTYFTSSKVIKDLILLHGKESFTCQIRQTFKTKEETVAWEHKFLTRIDAASNPDWFNKSNGAGKFHTTSESEESRLSTRNARTPEQKRATTEKRLVSMNAKTPEQKRAIKEKRKATLKNTISAKTPEEKQASVEKRLVSMNAKTPEQKRATNEKIKATLKNTISAKKPEQKRATKEKRLVSMNAKTPEEKQASVEKWSETRARNKLVDVIKVQNPK